jgi:hypothetical protein
MVRALRLERQHQTRCHPHQCQEQPCPASPLTPHA